MLQQLQYCCDTNQSFIKDHTTEVGGICCWYSVVYKLSSLVLDGYQHHKRHSDQHNRLPQDTIQVF